MTYKTTSIARSLALLGVILGFAGAPAAAVTGDSGYASADLARLAGLLGQRGWVARADIGGNLLISRSGPSPRAQAAPAETSSPSRSAPDTTMLAEMLPKQGWTVQREAGGTLTLFPPSWADQGLLRPEAAPQGETDLEPAALANRFDASGATEPQGSAGNVPHPQIGASPAAAPVGQIAMRHPFGITQPPVGQLAALGESLRQRGWGVGQESDGTLTLHPRIEGAELSAGTPVPTKIAATEGPRIEAALAKRGWDLRQDAVGNLFLTPLA